MSKVIILIFILSTQSSYTHDGEYPSNGKNFDTIQWWLSSEDSFRISTFALTNDIHIYEIKKAMDPQFAIENTKKHYGDIIVKSFQINLSSPDDEQYVSKEITKIMGRGAIERIKHLKMGFWNYDGRKYTTKTEP